MKGRGIPALHSMVSKGLPERVIFNGTLKDGKKTAMRRKEQIPDGDAALLRACPGKELGVTGEGGEASCF